MILDLGNIQRCNKEYRIIVFSTSFFVASTSFSSAAIWLAFVSPSIFSIFHFNFSFALNINWLILFSDLCLSNITFNLFIVLIYFFAWNQTFVPDHLQMNCASKMHSSKFPKYVRSQIRLEIIWNVLHFTYWYSYW